MTDSQKRYKEVLDAIYEDCQRQGSIKAIYNYVKTYGVSQTLGIALQQLSIMSKNGHTYTWLLRRPDHAMVLEVTGFINSYVNKKKDNNTTEVSHSSAIAVNLDDLLTAFDMLPKKMSLSERKSIAKQMANWKNS